MGEFYLKSQNDDNAKNFGQNKEEKCKKCKHSFSNKCDLREHVKMHRETGYSLSSFILGCVLTTTSQLLIKRRCKVALDDVVPTGGQQLSTTLLEGKACNFLQREVEKKECFYGQAGCKGGGGVSSIDPDRMQM